MAPPPPQREYPRPAYAWYVVGVLTLLYVFSFIDRQILNLLVKPIRRDLGISDTQMSLLMGFSFAVFYTFFGILLGRAADTRSRRGIIAAGCLVWSLFTAGCGFARNFAQMLLARVGVGIGEAALSPAAYSLIADYFPPQRLATAISVYSMAIYLGSGLAYLLGGAVIGAASSREAWQIPLAGAIRSWQLIFLMTGLPGLALAFLLLTVREPARAFRPSASDAPGFLAFVRRNFRTLTCHNTGFALIAFSNYGAAAWIPTFFIRRHGWTASEIGFAYGAIVLCCGTLGIVAGGRLADALTARGVRDATLRVGLLAALAWFFTGIAVYRVSDPRLALALLAVTNFCTSAPFGVAPAAIQQIAPPALRGQASALYLFVVNLFGLGLGPSAVAMMTDYAFRNDAQVGDSLLTVSLTAHVLASTFLWFGLKPFRATLAARTAAAAAD